MSRTELSIDFRRLRDLAQAQGWSIDQTRSLRWRFTPPIPTAEVVLFSGVSGDHRALANFTARLRASGLHIQKEPKGKQRRKGRRENH